MAGLGLHAPAVVAHSLGGGIMLDMAARGRVPLSSLALLSQVGLAPACVVGMVRVATPSVAAPLDPDASTRWRIPPRYAIGQLHVRLLHFARRQRVLGAQASLGVGPGAARTAA
jgi:pimeloyl-ACP methyl ester carboxylesterase